MSTAWGKKWLAPCPVVGYNGTMQLSEWIKREGISREDAAKRIGVTVSGLNKWLYGFRHPRPSQARRIVEATDGAVTASDLLDAPQATARAGEAA